MRAATRLKVFDMRTTTSTPDSNPPPPTPTPTPSQQVTFLILDEADRMLDLGFEPHIRAIAGHIRSDRQTLMFSATWPSAVQQLAAGFLSRPVKVTVGSLDLSASHTITQVRPSPPMLLLQQG